MVRSKRHRLWDIGIYAGFECPQCVRYRTRDEARADLFEYTEVFYNRKRRHGYIGNVRFKRKNEL